MNWFPCIIPNYFPAAVHNPPSMRHSHPLDVPPGVGKASAGHDSVSWARFLLRVSTSRFFQSPVLKSLAREGEDCPVSTKCRAEFMTLEMHHALRLGPISMIHSLVATVLGCTGHDLAQVPDVHKDVSCHKEVVLHGAAGKPNIAVLYVGNELGHLEPASDVKTSLLLLWQQIHRQDV